jgi:hypothetical protein
LTFNARGLGDAAGAGGFFREAGVAASFDFEGNQALKTQSAEQIACGLKGKSTVETQRWIEDLKKPLHGKRFKP